MATATKQTSAVGDASQELDVMQVIILDHNNVRALYARFVQATTVEEKEAIANAIVRELAVHGEAEEVSVYCRLDEEDLKGVTNHSQHEHQELEEALYAFDQTSIKDQPAYDQRFPPVSVCPLLAPFPDLLRDLILNLGRHAEEEELDILLKLHTKLSREMNHKLAIDFLNARQMVPHLPHPFAPQTGRLGQKLLGLLTKLVDMRKESTRVFAELRYNHPASATTGRT